MLYSPEDRRWGYAHRGNIGLEEGIGWAGMKGCTETEKEEVGGDESRILSYASSYAVPRDRIADTTLNHMATGYR
jgi:hypothetical protein